MTEQLTTTAETPPRRSLPRALTPFRHPAYRRLAVALMLNTFAGGVWIVALVWEVTVSYTHLTLPTNREV